MVTSANVKFYNVQDMDEGVDIKALFLRIFL